MLKISIQESERDKVTLLLAGRIANSEVEQLGASCRQILESGSKLTLDLAGVSFIDRNGVALVHNLEDQRAQLVNTSPFVGEQLKRKKSTAASKPGRKQQNNPKGEAQ